jgi:GDP-4-dehydro-6-deoxy-D-mannose reductase
MRLLITGASGFTGMTMIRLLASRKNISIAGLGRENPVQLPEAPCLSWVHGDILNPDTLSDTVSAVDPDAVLHLAGLNHGPLTDLRKTNVTGTKNILDATLGVNPSCPILVVSSSAVYGYAGYSPITETQILNPLSNYGISKAEQEVLCNQYIKTRDCQIAVVRPFNLVGPHQPVSFVCGKIVQQVIEIEEGTRNFLDLMDIRSSRDFIDVRDAVNGYWALLVHPEFSRVCAGNVFNAGSGRPCAISDVIGLIETITGDHYQVQTSKDNAPIPVPFQQSDNSRIHAATGWTPVIPLSDSLRDMLDAARNLVKGG